MENKKYTCNDMPKLCSCPFCGSENITIRYGADGYTSNVHYPNETGFVACLKCGARSLKTRYAKNAVKKWNARKESNAAALKWISVEERLPEESGKYLVYTYDDHIIDAYYSEEAGKWRSYSVVVADKRFTHWMPLPMPPKEE